MVIVTIETFLEGVGTLRVCVVFCGAFGTRGSGGCALMCRVVFYFIAFVTYE